MPFAPQVGSVVTAQSPHLCPSFVIASVLVAPQTEQVYVMVPASSHVAAEVTVPLSQVWLPVAAISLVSVCEESFAHVLVSMPFAPQVGSVVTVQSPHLCPSFVIASVLVPPQTVQVYVITPSFSQVAGVVTSPSFQVWLPVAAIGLVSL